MKEKEIMNAAVAIIAIGLVIYAMTAQTMLTDYYERRWNYPGNKDFSIDF